MMPSFCALALAFAVLPRIVGAVVLPSVPLPLDSESSSRVNLTLVRLNAELAATHSWEIGTLTEALLELEWPALSIFGKNAISPPSLIRSKDTAADVLAIVNAVVTAKPAGSFALIDGDGAVGDPASLGVAVTLAARALLNETDATAAEEQLNYLLLDAPRAPSGAISHRLDQVQLWADFMYMAPPFIAYFGALDRDSQGNTTLLQAAYDQSRWYREALFDADASLWRHVVYGVGEDANHWGTGNAWAAAGMMRVLETLNTSAQAHAFRPQQADLIVWIDEILTGAWAHQQSNGTLFNYIDQLPPATFADTSSTALLAATSFRHAIFTNTTTHIDAAQRAYDLIQQSVDNTGILTGTVDPETFNTTTVPGGVSPEGQSFVLLLEAARDAWKARGVR